MLEKLIYKPSTIGEKIRRLQLAIKYIIRDIDDQQIYFNVIHTLDEWKSGLGNGVSIQKKERAVKVQLILHTIQDPNEFLEHAMVCLYFTFGFTTNNNVCCVGKGETV